MDEYSVQQAADALGLTESAIRKRIQRGEMAARRVGARMLLISKGEVERWQKLGKQRPGPKPKQPTADDLRRDMTEHQDALDEGRRRIRGGREPSDDGAAER
jgi:excisionase family DNA binding protein